MCYCKLFNYSLTGGPLFICQSSFYAIPDNSVSSRKEVLRRSQLYVLAMIFAIRAGLSLSRSQPPIPRSLIISKNESDSSLIRLSKQILQDPHVQILQDPHVQLPEYSSSFVSDVSLHFSLPEFSSNFAKRAQNSR